MCVRSHLILSGTRSGSDLRYKLPLLTMMDMIYHKNNFFGKLSFIITDHLLARLMMKRFKMNLCRSGIMNICVNEEHTAVAS